jgi:hypothetical protein
MGTTGVFLSGETRRGVVTSLVSGTGETSSGVGTAVVNLVKKCYFLKNAVK